MIVSAVEVQVGVDRECMHLEIPGRESSGNLPRVLAIAIEAELHKPERSQCGDPDGILVDNDVQRQAETAPRIEKLDFGRVIGRPEYIDPPARTIQGEDPAVGPRRDGVNTVELTRPVSTPPNSER